MLYRPEAFEPLTNEPWEEARVRAAIAGIVSEADEAFDPVGLWPAEEWDSYNTPTPLTDLYVGAAGVVWALGALRRRGHAETRIDLAAAASRAVERWREAPGLMAGVELPAAAEAGLLGGDTGILAVAWRLTGHDELEDALLSRVVESRGSDAHEVMWGAPGTLLAARAMLDWTGKEHWAKAWHDTAEAVWNARCEDDVWTQMLHGAVYRGLGPVHGLVGNALALLGGRELLPEDRRERLLADTAAVVERNAVLEDGLANWPPVDGGHLVGRDGGVRLQWCHGAPGIVASTSSFLSEELLAAGAELTWRAGPSGTEKGSSICHGTAGNGYAFLKLFERTGDERWLERARQFAVHALEQVERRGTGRYSLWTGDLGVAIYTADCLDGRTAYPILETWD